MGWELGLTDEANHIMDESNNIKDDLIEIIMARKSKIREDEVTAEQNTWSTAGAKGKRKAETRSAGARRAQSPRRTSTHKDTQRRVAPREGARNRSREAPRGKR